MRIIRLLGIYVILALGLHWSLTRFAGLEGSALVSMHILGLALFLWITELTHPTLTGLLIFCLIPTLGVLSPADTVRVMGDTIVWRLFGIFLIARGMKDTGLARRIAFNVLSFARGNLRRLILLMELLTFLFVFLVPAAVARTAILAAICMELVVEIHKVSGNDNFAKAASIIIPATSLITSSALMFGASSTIYTAAFLESNLNYYFTYGDWMKAALPANLLILVVIFVVVTLRFPFPARISGTEKLREMTERGPFSTQEKKMIVIMAMLLVAWIADLGRFAPVEMIGGTLLLLPGIQILDRKSAFQNLEWETLLLFGAGLAMAAGLNHTGAIDTLIGRFSGNLYAVSAAVVAFAIAGITIITRLGVSNMTGVVATLLPVFTALARSMGINPVWACMICVMASGTGILLPAQSSSMLATYRYGYFTSGDLWKTTLPIILIYAVFIVLTAIFYWPMIGIPFR